MLAFLLGVWSTGAMAGEKVDLVLYSYEWSSEANDFVLSEKTEYIGCDRTTGESDLELGYAWDAVTKSWVNSSKVEAFYEGNDTTYIFSNWDEDADTWVNDSKTEFLHDEKGNRISLSYYDWNAETEKWVGRERDEYQYDDKGRCSMYIPRDWDSEIQDWVGKGRQTIYVYDTNGNRVSEISSSLDESGEKWEQRYKIEFTYGENGKVETEYIEDNYHSSVLKTKIEYEYDEAGNCVLETRAVWENDNWKGTGRIEYTYDANKNCTLEVDYSGETLHTKRECSYDERGNMTYVAHYRWNSGAEEWVGYGEALKSTFDETGLETLWYDYEWDSEKKEWSVISKEVCEYMNEPASLPSVPSRAVIRENGAYDLTGRKAEASKKGLVVEGGRIVFRK
jgi:hypothetical protein